MDRIQKALARLTLREKNILKNILHQILQKNTRGLDVKKLKGREDIFRVRKGDLRVIYQINGGSVFILVIERRSEKTYRRI